MSRQGAILKHLEFDYTEPIRDPLWNNINLSIPLMKIISTPVFQKLSRIKQLGPSYLVYPGATHTRLNHSLGVFHLAKRMIQRLFSFDSCMDLSLEGIKAFLCAALLHDLGHYPYAHSLKELPLQTHEGLTVQIVMSTPVKRLIREALGTLPEMVAAIVDITIDVKENREILFFRNLLSGVLDPDKLDYLNRDAYFCGVPYGMQDIDFIINRIIPWEKRGLAIQIQGLPAVENILFSKYLMYKTVYWHRTVRIATAMIRKAVFFAINEHVIQPSDMYGLDDEEFYQRFSRYDKPPLSYVFEVFNRRLFKALCEVPFDENNTVHCDLTDMTSRNWMETEIAKRVGKSLGQPIPGESIIIDIPEPINFEINMPIIDSDRIHAFESSGSVFNNPIIEGFKKSLRKIRIMCPPELSESPINLKKIIPWI
ncbi:MAG: HD domain-containing protein [Spirochaetota bacterium]